MSSEQQNPMELVLSRDKEIGSRNHENGPIAYSFSIRQHVLAAREKDLSLSWPFPERYLYVCLKNGIKNVLPPLEVCDSTTNHLQGEVSSACCQEKRENDACSETNNVEIAGEKCLKVGCDSTCNEAISKVSTQHNNWSFSSESCKHGQNNHLRSNSVLGPLFPRIQLSSNIPCLHPLVDQRTKMVTTPKRLRHKQWKRKGKAKKRYLTDILAVAKRCTLKEVCRVEGLRIDSKKNAENVSDGNIGISMTEDGCKSELDEEQEEKHQVLTKTLSMPI
ncbi:unnamed protein product [Ilex paraguariensis]|uniref:Uncharacterized protein n=1 Tax=Ilex paraguariensis TaxID=185542 RepID=A0ABC8V208_9AQUA